MQSAHLAESLPKARLDFAKLSQAKIQKAAGRWVGMQQLPVKSIEPTHEPITVSAATTAQFCIFRARARARYYVSSWLCWRPKFRPSSRLSRCLSACLPACLPVALVVRLSGWLAVVLQAGSLSPARHCGPDVLARRAVRRLPPPPPAKTPTQLEDNGRRSIGLVY